MTIPKPPTPQGVSALLKRAGFSTVYAREGAVRVKHLFWSMRATPEQHAAKLAPYAKAIAEAGWSVETAEYELIVTAGKADR